MAITYDATSTTTTGDSTTALTWSHTCSGLDRGLIVAIGSNGATASGVTYAGVAMTALGTQIESTTGYRVSLWSLIAPAIGANNIVASFAATQAVECRGVSFNGVNQTNMSGTFTGTANAATTVGSITIASSATELVVDAFVWNHTGFPASASVGAQQTFVGTAAGAFARLSMSTESGSATVAMSWSCTAATNWAQAGVSLKPSSSGGTIAPIVFASVASNSAVIAGTTISCTAPGGIVQGDLLFAMLMWATGTETIDVTPTNWTLIRTTPSGGANKVTLATYYHSASAAEVGTYTWGITGTGVPRAISIWRISNPHPTTPFDISTGGSGVGASVVATAGTTGFNNEMVCFVAAFNSDGSGVTFSVPSGYTQHTNVNTFSNASLFGAEQTQAGAGSTGTPTTNAGGVIATEPWATQIVAFRPGVQAVDPRQYAIVSLPQEISTYYNRRWPMSYVAFMMRDTTPPALLASPVFKWTDLPIEFTYYDAATSYPIPWTDVPRQANGPPAPSPSPSPSPGPGPSPSPTPTPGVTSSNTVLPRISLPPPTLSDNEQWQRQSAAWMAEANQGHLQNTGIVTLAANANNTVVTDDRCGITTFIGFMPRTASASTELGSGVMYISSQGKQTFTITHSNTPDTDRTFIYTLLG